MISAAPGPAVIGTGPELDHSTKGRTFFTMQITGCSNQKCTSVVDFSFFARVAIVPASWGTRGETVEMGIGI